ncbi:DUF2855 family protein [Sandaracinobacteroides saxicola]|uniref:DUF2855 family protein n=1 Tax=Sandaracinobacteroides saxicola TaxID=2759707 RepID=A0A7G5IF01_9SPHN|nr:DUF2855 family protein [Sandaracinobacteroides saxicola]QMW21943.1 DUF2855 family protein [Sandaracinobacteroides saxicola]
MQTTEIRLMKNDPRTREVAPVERAPGPGQALARIDRFALTSNNVTYAAIGEAMGYWRFFPAPEPWIIMPVWGFATVTESRAEGVAAGDRFYGYWPSASHALLTPGPVKAHGFADMAPHRQALPPIYNAYSPVAPGTDEAAAALFRPLYGTGFVLADHLVETAEPGAIILTSASSKTALATAEGLRAAGRPATGLTSAANRDFTLATGYYDQVLAYDDLATLDAGAPATLVDFSGNARLKAALHRHLRGLGASHIVGATHWDVAPDAEPLPGPTPALFFAPTVWAAKAKAMGPAAFDAAMAAGMARFLATTRPWLTIIQESGPAAYETRLDKLLAGTASPAEGYVISL